MEGESASAKAVRLRNATAKWVSDQPENTLSDISLTISPGKYVDTFYFKESDTIPELNKMGSYIMSL